MNQRPALFTGSALLLLTMAVGMLLSQSQALQALNPVTAILVTAGALFCIVNGFSHPNYGYVSFDRVAQVAAILLLGPVPAALLNGIASLLFPLKRLRQGGAWRDVMDSSLANAGMMVMVILGSGWLYQRCGGSLPLQGLGSRDVLPLLALAVSLHFLNEIIMLWFTWLRGRALRQVINTFSYVVELFSILIGVCLAALLPQIGPGETAVLLMILAAGMMALRQLAELRMNLQKQVDQRTCELQAKTAELDRMARVDALTGLVNRGELDRLLEQTTPAQQSKNRWVVVLDIDHFKQVNDRVSHSHGDQVLRRFGELIAAGLQPGDIAGRYGGDEFIMMLQRASRDAAIEDCHTLLQQLSGQAWTQSQEAVTASAGLTAWAPGESKEHVLARADARLYRAKSDGRNRIRASD